MLPKSKCFWCCWWHSFPSCTQGCRQWRPAMVNSLNLQCIPQFATIKCPDGAVGSKCIVQASTHSALWPPTAPNAMIPITMTKVSVWVFLNENVEKMKSNNQNVWKMKSLFSIWFARLRQRQRADNAWFPAHMCQVTHLPRQSVQWRSSDETFWDDCDSAWIHHSDIGDELGFGQMVLN